MLSENSTKTLEKKQVRFRIALIGFLFIALFITIGSRAVYLQVFRGPWLSQKAAYEYEKYLTLNGKRGTIFDSKLKEMAVSIEVTSVAAHPSQIKDVKTAALLLARELGMNHKKLTRKLGSKRAFVWIKRQISPREAKAVRNLKLEGIGFIPEHNRFYPNTMLAAQVVGFTGIDGRGLEGIEFSYDTYLKGSAGKFKIFKDALGRRFSRAFASEAGNAQNYSGKNLVLTIDSTIQYVTEKALKQSVTRFSAKSGMAVVMHPKTGAVLALAHYPLFNPNSYRTFGREQWRNRAITDPFEPGSTMKIFSAAAAIESGYCSPDTIFFCENGKYKVGEDIVHDTRSHGWLTLQKIIKYSSNIGAVKISEMIGPESLYNTLRGFGFGKKTRVDCPGETAGNLSSYRRWSKIDTGAISFGQGISVSAIQLVTAVSAIANEGILMKPYIVREITDHKGNTLETFAPREVRKVISARTAGIVKKMMKSVVDRGGTGVNAALKSYTACGKTGTAQKINKKGEYADGKYIASFVGFAPEDHPELAILVVINEPEDGHYGGIVAAPAFREIAHETLNYMNVLPNIDTDKLTVSKESGKSG
ncbi:MAG: penicillin-binding protein 2 [Desulfobacteraceae bacterium]|nr:penicillin-binding protein 2 [Desulfobacteraceae bacterium]